MTIGCGIGHTFLGCFELLLGSSLVPMCCWQRNILSTLRGIPCLVLVFDDSLSLQLHIPLLLLLSQEVGSCCSVHEHQFLNMVSGVLHERQGVSSIVSVIPVCMSQGLLRL